jgi:hypothetical protein
MMHNLVNVGPPPTLGADPKKPGIERASNSIDTHAAGHPKP